MFDNKLENFDDDFFENVENNSVSYSNLPPGKYRFIVRGSNNDDV